MILYQTVSVDGTDYLYDTGSNAIVELPEGVGPGLDEALRRNGGRPRLAEALSAGSDAAEFVEETRSANGLFQPHPPRNYRGVLDPDRIARLLDHGMRGLLLGVTEGCNLRCSYCIYSGGYEGQRTHGAGRMSWDTARRSMDYFAERAGGGAEPFITFYGGEPLTAWSLVRRSVEYARGLPIPGLQLLINTNLTLLDEAKATFLAENDVALAVSVDGPEVIHDGARRFPSGKPTHARVLHWLEYLREHHRAYFDRRIFLHVTFDPESDIRTVFDFFCDDRWRGLPISIGGIRQEGPGSERRRAAARARHGEALDEILDRHVPGLRGEDPIPHSLLVNLFRHVFHEIPSRRIAYPPPDANPMRTCTPGVTRLYVGADGGFYPCEKTDVPAACIGDIDHGIDPARVRRLLQRQVRFCESDCQDCWAWRLCSLCLTHFIEGGAIRSSEIRRKCKEERERIRLSLARFVRLYNQEPEATWDHPFSLHHAVEAADR